MSSGSVAGGGVGWRRRRVAGVARQRLGLVVDVLIEQRVAGELVEEQVTQRALRPALDRAR